ncbi:odorant receptor 7a [Agrilus planipennis]|uniref:Odorant receptor 7a n=1 Tax=Agrilus planipennis TaxID=224129 RepID=A0A1W4W5I0_AGRPL|nr:odorant receptor 7a [Agrilus planipennis]
MTVYSGAHLKVLMEALRTIRVRSYRRMNVSYVPKLYDTDKGVHGIMDEEINICIVHLQTIFRMCETIEDTFNVIALLQILQSVTVLCAGLYVVSEVPITSGKFFAELAYLLAVTWQIFQYCWYGNKLTQMSLATSDALFEGDWLCASKSFKMKMVFSMCRLGKPVIFTGGKLTLLTLPTFVSIARFSYSIYAILKNGSGGQ